MLAPLYRCHYNDVIMGVLASQITSPTLVYSTVYSGAEQRKHQSSASLAFVRGIQRRPGNSPHKGPVTLKMFPFDDVIMCCYYCRSHWRSRRVRDRARGVYRHLIFGWFAVTLFRRIIEYQNRSPGNGGLTTYTQTRLFHDSVVLHIKIFYIRMCWMC